MTKEEIATLKQALDEPLMSHTAADAIRILIRQALRKEREAVK